MSFVEESSGSSASESKVVAPNKLRFTIKDPAKQTQPQFREPESSLESGNASKAEGESIEKKRKKREKSNLFFALHGTERVSRNLMSQFAPCKGTKSKPKKTKQLLFSKSSKPTKKCN
jgi:hypothetical protein